MQGSKTPSQNRPNNGNRIVVVLFVIAGIMSVFLYFVYRRSETELQKSFSKMQEAGKTLTIDGCVKKNIEWYQSCTAMSQLCEQSVVKMMRICLANGDKAKQCAQYGDEVLGYNFGATECRPYYSKKSLKKACADTYQALADYCKAVRESR